jgi:hypothetical protein
MPKRTPDQLEETVNGLINEYVNLASRLASMRIELDALREVLSKNAPPAVAGYDELRDRLLQQHLDHLDSIVAKAPDAAFQLRVRRLLEGFDGPKQ